MKTVRLCVLVLVLSSLPLIQAARLARNCNSKWAQTVNCHRNSVSKAAERDPSFPVPSDGEKRRLENAVNNCFSNKFQCSGSPIPSSQQAKTRQDCFNQVKNSLRGQLQECVKRSVEDFNMPDDPYDPNNDWSYHVLTIQNALKNPQPLCGNANKKDLQNCVNQLGYDFNKQPPNKPPPYVCRADVDCWSNWGADCQNTWEYQIVPHLCHCSQELQRQKAVKSAQDQYNACLTARGQTPAKDDPVLKWVDSFLRGMCTTSQNSPCRREREEVDTYDRAREGMNPGDAKLW